LAAVVLAFVSWRNGQEASRQRNEAVAQRNEAAEQRKQASLLALDSSKEVARVAQGLSPESLKPHPIKAAHFYLRAAGAAQSLGDRRTAELELLAAAYSVTTLIGTLSHGDEGEVRDVQFLAEDSRIVSWASDDSIRLWDVRDGSPVSAPLKHPGLFGLVVRPGGGEFVALGGGSLSLRRARDGGEIRTFSYPNVVRAGFSPDGATLWSVSWQSLGGPEYMFGSRATAHASFWDVGTGKQRYSISFPVSAMTENSSLKFSPDGSRVLVVDLGGLEVRHAADGAIAYRIASPQAGPPPVPGVAGPPLSWVPLQEVEVSSDGRLLRLRWHGLGDRLFDFATGRPSRIPTPENKSEFAFSADGRRVLRITAQELRVLDATTGEPVGVPVPRAGNSGQALLTPDGEAMIVFQDREGWILAVEDGRRLGRVALNQTLQRTADGRHMMKREEGEAGVLYRILDDEPKDRWREAKEVWLEAHAESAAAKSELVRIVDERNDTERLPGVRYLKKVITQGETQPRVFSREGSTYVSLENDRTARLWHTRRSPLLLGTLEFPQAAFFPAGDRILAWNPKRWELAVCSARDGTRMAQPTSIAPTGAQEMETPVISSDGRFVVVEMDDGNEVLSFEVRAGGLGPPQRFRAPARVYLRENLSPDGVHLAAQDDTGVGIWDIREGRRVGDLKLPDQAERGGGLRFNRDGRNLLLMGGAKFVVCDLQGRILAPASVVATGQEIAWGKFSPDDTLVLLGVRGDGGSESIEVWDWRNQKRVHEYPLVEREAPTQRSNEPVFPGMVGVAAPRGLRYLGLEGRDFAAGGSRLLHEEIDPATKRPLGPALYDPRTGRRVAGPFHHPGMEIAAVAPDARHIVTLGSDAKLWNTSEGRPVGKRILLSEIQVERFKLTSRYLVIYDSNGVALWSTEQGDRVARIVFDKHTVQEALDSVQVSADERRLLISASDRTELWDLQPSNEVPIDKQILELEVRTATAIGADGDVQVLPLQQWESKRLDLTRSRGSAKPRE
jgi:WD40 repeat protein